MKLRLIQSGGFAGKIKIAEEELADYPPSLQQFVQNLFLQQPPNAESMVPGKGRDKENYVLEFNNESLPLPAIPPNAEMDKLVKKLKANLKFKKY